MVIFYSSRCLLWHHVHSHYHLNGSCQVTEKMPNNLLESNLLQLTRGNLWKETFDHTGIYVYSETGEERFHIGSVMLYDEKHFLSICNYIWHYKPPWGMNDWDILQTPQQQYFGQITGRHLHVKKFTAMYLSMCVGRFGGHYPSEEIILWWRMKKNTLIQ